MSILHFIMTQMANVPLDTASARPVRVAGHMRSPTVETGYRDKYSQRNLPLDGVAGALAGQPDAYDAYHGLLFCVWRRDGRQKRWATCWSRSRRLPDPAASRRGRG